MFQVLWWKWQVLLMWSHSTSVHLPAVKTLPWVTATHTHARTHAHHLAPLRCARVLRRASVLSLKLLVVISNIFHVIVTAVLDRGVVSSLLATSMQPSFDQPRLSIVVVWCLSTSAGCALRNACLLEACFVGVGQVKNSVCAREGGRFHSGS